MITAPSKEKRMVELIDILNDACQKYYSPTPDDEVTMSDAQYDRYLSELIHLEADTGIKFEGSPTMKVGFTEPEEKKIRHYAPVLSLKDTKNVDDMLYFLGEEEALLSWKLDGVSIVLYYSFGALQRAVSRGDGHQGKDITKNVMLLQNVPLNIPLKHNLIVRGEGCVSLKDFDRLKKTAEAEKYSNPRSMASGLINGTKTTNVLLRHMHFIAHSIVMVDGPERSSLTTRSRQLDYLKRLNFKVVRYVHVYNYQLKSQIENYTSEIERFEFPVDGLVLTLNDIKLSDSLGATAKYPKHSIAFKWPDEIALTTVTGMKWSVSSTGLITPVVTFTPVNLEGTDVKQANLHTLKVFEELEIGKGDTLRIFKANKIIPEVLDNLTRSGTEEYPKYCPVCGTETTVVANEKTRKLYCFMCGNRN